MTGDCIDCLEWHQGDDLPAGLDPAAAGTHIGMFLTWIILNDCTSEAHEDDHAEALEAVQSRTLTGRGYLMDKCGGNLRDTDLGEDAQLFAKEYYGSNAEGHSPYLEDYERTLAAGLPSIYHVQDGWDNYDLLAPVIDAAYERWTASQQ
ncbi:hypothetical protein PWT90_03999 [Aphanocladium album]|nr:hypothetical protein PWT90_03999 [Aphanocladium album]